MSSRYRIVIAAPMVVAAAVGCRSPSAATEASVPSASAHAASAPSGSAGHISVANDADLTAMLCAGRAGCRLRGRHPIGAADGLLFLEIAVPRGAGSVDCDGGEYWMVRSMQPIAARRMARDCNTQSEADGLAHAQTQVEGNDFVLAYQELRGGDRCAGVDARLEGWPLHLATETRWDGASERGRCGRDNEIAMDWDRSDPIAQWSAASCSGESSPSAPALVGVAIPRFTLDGSPAPTAVGSCGALVDGARASRWSKQARVAAGVRFRAMVVDDRLFVDVDGATDGSVSVAIASAALGDGDHGGLGCGSDDDRHPSVTRLHLTDGRTESKGTQAPIFQVTAREGDTIHLASDTIGGVGRLALSYESLDHQKLESAVLGKTPSARGLPPLSGPFKASERCELAGDRLDVRRDNAPADPAIRLP